MPTYFSYSFVPWHSFAGIVPVPSYKGVMLHTCRDYTLTPVNSVNPTVYKFHVIVSVCITTPFDMQHQVSYYSAFTSDHVTLYNSRIYITTSATTQQVSVSTSHFDTHKLQCKDYIIFWCKFIESVRASIPSPLRLVIS